MKNKWKDLASILVILIYIVILMVPNFTAGVIGGSDGLFHVQRMTSLADGLRHGLFPVKLRPVLMHTYGYGVGFFYPDFFLYFPAALILAGVSIEWAYKIYLIVMCVIGGVSCYAFTTKRTGKRLVALLGAILLLSSPLLFAQIYNYGAVGTITAYMFLPMAFYGLIDSLEGNLSSAKWYGIGVLAIVLSHHITFITLFICSIVILLVNIRKVIRKPIVICHLLKYCLISMAISTAYWLPLFEQIYHEKYRFLYSNIYSAQDNVMGLDEIIPALGASVFWVFVVAGVLSVIRFFKKKDGERNYIGYVIAAAIMILFMTSQIIWKSFIGAMLANIQSTSRFVPSVITLCIVVSTFVIGDVADSFGNKKLFVAFSGALLVICSIYSVVKTNARVEKLYQGIDFERTEVTEELMLVERRGMGAGQEMLPVATWYENANEPQTAKADDEESADGVKLDNGKSFDVWLNFDKQYYDVPYIYYYGYKAYVLDDTGIVRELEVGKSFESNGYLRVYIPEDLSGIGHVVVTYRKTMIQWISYIVTVIASLLVFGYIVRHMLIQKKKQQVVE